MLLLYAALCYVLLEIGFASRGLIEAAPFHQSPPPILPSAAYPPQLAGMNISLEQYPHADQRRAALQKLVDAGFRWVRQRADWGQLEPLPGDYNWAQMDGILADVTASGLEAVMLLDGSPAWARAPQDRPPTDNPFAPPAANANFARFAAAFARRYGASVRFYQIWDEPNIAPHWGNRLIEPVAYGRMLAEVAPPIRAADTDAVILLAALAPTADRGHTAIDEAYFLQRLYAAGAAPYFDAVAVQPFGFGLAPDDPRSRRETLNFRRVGLLRRVMVAAGDGAKPIWAVRYGWNRSTSALWQTVTPATQMRFIREANALAGQWWWLAGLGWAIDRPATATDPLSGFSLYTPDGLPLDLWDQFALINRSPVVEARSQPWPLAGQLIFWLVLLSLILWRGWQAATIARVDRWPNRFASLPLAMRVIAWLILLVIYFFATWPPLIGLCWLIAALFLAAGPVAALVLVGFLLPFHYQHKELQLVGAVLAVPPSYAVLLCSLPGMVRRWPVQIPKRRPTLYPTDWLALGWLVITLLSAMSAGPWPGKTGDLWWMAGGPLLLYMLGRSQAITPARRTWAVLGLATGGVLAALIGLVLWWGGAGTVVDGVRRLVGLTFSPNQTALLLVRSLFLCVGLGIVDPRRGKWGWAVAAGVIGLALLLTGSRGALLLGIPAGVVLILAVQPGIQARLLARSWLWAGMAVAVLSLLTFTLGGRILNSGTVLQRLHIWEGALDLWRAFPWLGSGPGGFFWRYPAFMTSAAATEPNLLHPHNIWLEFVTGWGVAGLIWAVCFCYWLVRRVTGQAVRGSGAAVGLLAALVAGVAHGQVDAFVLLPELAAWNWLAIGLLAADAKINAKR